MSPPAIWLFKARVCSASSRILKAFHVTPTTAKRMKKKKIHILS
jgi:hypothetical protein